MKGLLIFRHALSMVLRNWREAIQIGLVPMLILFGFLVFLLGPDVMGFARHVDVFTVESVPSSVVLRHIFWILFVTVVCVVWVFVGWHRFVLLGEYPNGWLPRPYFGSVLRYLARLAQVMLIGVFLLIPLTIFSAFALSAPGTGNGVFFGFYAVLLIVFFRVSPILPAAAIGGDLRLGQAFVATKGASVAFFVLIGLGGAVLVAVVLLAGFADRAIGGISVLLLVPANLLLTLLWVSIVTTVYGHYVENRALN